ncbi:hypothetical protein E2C01_025689 [Portunus trituberculatus]|uniref:Uncharacterized protein n=1 Tax=Portunus trituberculatus TaxID=210409 RepID=A0A5B7EGL6_PORTR|nr:hypothetical protein [Portunus trituberculatus]
MVQRMPQKLNSFIYVLDIAFQTIISSSSMKFNSPPLLH